MGGEGVGDGDFRGAAAGNEGAFFHEAADDADGVVEGAFGFVEDEGVGAAADDGDGFSLVRGAGGGGRGKGWFDGGDTCDFDDAGAGGLDFVDEVGGAEFVFGEGVDVGDGFAAGRFADEFDFVAFDLFDSEDVEFGEEVQA